MGEAKRRKQLDSTYGNKPSLTSPNQQQKHVDLVINELSHRFTTEIKQIAAADSQPDTYNDCQQEVANWLNLKLQKYREGDRTLIASSIMTVYAEIAMKQETSPLLIKFWFEVLEPYLEKEKRDRIAKIVNKIDREFDRD